MNRYLWVGLLILSLAGVVLTGYLTQAHFAGSIGAICQEGQGCGVVLQSAWSQFAGLPTAFYGFCYYLLAFVLVLLIPYLDEEYKPVFFNGLVGLNLAAFGISVTLVGYAILGLGTTCTFCNTSFALVALLTGGTLYWRKTGTRVLEYDNAASLWQIGTIVFLISTLLLVGILTTQGERSQRVESKETQRELQALANDSRSLGDPQAPIRVVEFFDLACPHCQKFALNTFPKIKQNYIDTGKVVWTFRSFPITRAHPNALYAHGALSLIPQNEYLAAKKTIMRNSKQWKGRYTEDPRTYFNLFLAQHGLNEGPSKELLREIRFSTRDYSELGIRQTPSFMVNGKIHKGALPYRRWRSIFDELLDNAN